MGKLVAAFVFFLAASALAIHESKPPRPRADDDAVAQPQPVRVEDAATIAGGARGDAAVGQVRGTACAATRRRRR